MLTDGAVGAPEEVVQYINKNNFNTRFHAFGIGDGASTYLINESAKAGLGKSYMVPDGDTTLNSKVISALKYACKPAFTGINVDWGTPKSNIIFQTPSESFMDNIQEGELLNIIALIKKSEISTA